MNFKRLQMNRSAIFSLIAGLAALQSLSGEETIETLATFTGPNGAYPGYLLQDKHGNFFGTTYTGGKYDKGTIFELPLNQPLETLISFDGSNGANPLSGLVEGPDGYFYGTTHSGGPGGKGTIFRLSPDDKLTTVVAFDGTNGAFPKSGLLLGLDSNLYGTTFSGGPSDDGVIFRLTMDGKYTQLVTFNGLNGINPGGLTLGSDGSFYGTTYRGGLQGLGTAFKYDTDGLLTFNGETWTTYRTGLSLPPLGTGADNGAASAGAGSYDQTAVVTFHGDMPPLSQQDVSSISSPPPPDSGPPVKFNGPNGSNPDTLARSSDAHTLSGTPYGGLNNPNFVVKYGPNPRFVSLVSFTGDNGANPEAQLSQLSDGNFYGTTFTGGANQKGTVFSVTPTGVLTLVHSFNVTDGANPNSGLIQWSDGYFYIERIWENEWIKAATVQWSGVNFCGTTSAGGEHHNGTVFRITSDGTLTTLVSFTGTSGKQLGTIPNSLIPGNDGNLYGTTYYGGKVNKGTVFRLLLQLWPPVSAGENATTFSERQPVLSR